MNPHRIAPSVFRRIFHGWFIAVDNDARAKDGVDLRNNELWLTVQCIDCHNFYWLCVSCMHLTALRMRSERRSL